MGNGSIEVADEAGEELLIMMDGVSAGLCVGGLIGV